MRDKKVHENIEFKRGLEPKSSLDIGENSIAMIYERIKDITKLVESTLNAKSYGEVEENGFATNNGNVENIIEQQYRFEGRPQEDAYFYIGNSYNPKKGWYLLHAGKAVIDDNILDYSEFIVKLKDWMKKYQQK